MDVYKNILFIFFIFGLILIIVDIVKTYNKCEPNKIVYRYVPRTFKEQQDNPVPLDDLFKVMFEQPTPFVLSFSVHDSKKDINDQFISQG